MAEKMTAQERSLYLHSLFKSAIARESLPRPEQEYKFALSREWRFDFAWPLMRIAVEIEGGNRTGAHMRHHGFRKDIEKYNNATKLGWRVFRFTADQIESGEAVRFMQEVIHASNKSVSLQ